MVVLVLGAQQSDSGIHIHISILFQILFPYINKNNIFNSLNGGMETHA